MRILLVSQYFWPESFIINDLVRTLAAQGHQVTVLTGKPNYPDGMVFDGYTASGTTREEYIPGVNVYRVPLRPRGKGGAKNLLLNYLSFVWNGVVHGPVAIKGKEFDVVFAFALSPITSVIPAIFLKWRLKKHLAVWIQDLWPESLSATGFIRNAGVLRTVGWMVRAIYACSDTLLVQSKAFQIPVARYAPVDKIIYYPNSYPDAAYSSPTCTQGDSDSAVLLDPQLLAMLEHDFCLVFAGNLGTAQSLLTIVEAAQRLQHLPRCKLVLVGSGSMSKWLEEQKAQKGLSNLILAGRFEPSQMPHFFSRAAGLLVTLKREEIFSYTVPSKVQAYLASGKPIIAAIDGEGARVIGEAKAGLTCAAEDAEGLAACITRLYDMNVDDRKALGQAGRSYFLNHFEMGGQCRRLVEILEARIGHKKGVTV